MFRKFFNTLRLVLVQYLNYCNLINLDQKARKKKCWGEKKEIEVLFEDLRLQAKIHTGTQGITIVTAICVNRSDSNGTNCVVKQCKCSFLDTVLLEGIF